MLQFLFRRAQHVVDDTIDAAVRRVAVAVPIIIAAGFLAAALSVWLNRQLGAAVGNLVMAGIFAALAGIVGVVTYVNRDQAGDEEADGSTSNTSETTSEAARLFSAADHDLMLSLAGKLAPAALPQLLRLLLKNLPVVVVVVVAAYVLSRPVQAEFGGDPSDG